MSEISLSKQAQDLQLGIYIHYKNREYEVLGVGINSETLEEYVIYKALYGKGLTWLRPLKMFLETIEIEGKVIPRFKHVSPNLTNSS